MKKTVASAALFVLTSAAFSAHADDRTYTASSCVPTAPAQSSYSYTISWGLLNASTSNYMSAICGASVQGLVTPSEIDVYVFNNVPGGSTQCWTYGIDNSGNEVWLSSSKTAGSSGQQVLVFTPTDGFGLSASVAVYCAVGPRASSTISSIRGFRVIY